MKQRTTITLNKAYLDGLKILALKNDSSVSQLISEAVGRLIMDGSSHEDNLVKDFFVNLKRVKSGHRFSKKEIKSYVESGRK